MNRSNQLPRLTRTARLITALLGCCATAVSRAQLVPIDSFLDMPDGVFYNIFASSTCEGGSWLPFTIEVGGSQVTVTTLGSTPPPGYEDGPYRIGCFNLSSPAMDYYRLPRDPAVDPGDYMGAWATATEPFGDLILDFSEPLTSFGFTSAISSFQCYLLNRSDTAMLYDGLHATGNLLGSISTTATTFSCFFTIDFVGLVGDAPQIRSVRFPRGDDGFAIDGIAVSLGPECTLSLPAEPAPVMTCGRTPATFTVVADGSPPYSYQWRKDGLPLSDGPSGSGSTIQGSTTDTLTILDATQDDEGAYDCEVAGACGNLASSAATLTVCTANLNGDLVVDLADYAQFVACQTGPGGTVSGGCACADADGDDDADLADFTLFQAAFPCP